MCFRRQNQLWPRPPTGQAFNDARERALGGTDAFSGDHRIDRRVRHRIKTFGVHEIIDLHCYPNTEPLIKSQGPYVEALAKYSNRRLDGKREAEVMEELKKFAVQVCHFEYRKTYTSFRPALTNEYVTGIRNP